MPIKSTSNSIATSMIDLTTLPDRSITCGKRPDLNDFGERDGAETDMQQVQNDVRACQKCDHELNGLDGFVRHRRKINRNQRPPEPDLTSDLTDEAACAGCNE